MITSHWLENQSSKPTWRTYQTNFNVEFEFEGSLQNEKPTNIATDLPFFYI
jgi:hypothetical protein